MLRGKDATLVAIIKMIIETEPETQDDIAKKLNISRRYVAKLIKPLVDKKIIKHPYIVDMDKLSKLDLYDGIDKPLNNIIDLYGKMANNVLYNLNKTFKSLKINDIETAKGVIAQDYRLNRMEEEIGVSIKMNSLRYLPMEQSMRLSVIAANIERCGDYISNIAEEITNGLKIDEQLYNDVELLFNIITEMFELAMDMVKTNTSSYKIYELEEELHKTIDTILEKISEKGCKSRYISYYIQFGMFLKDIERFGDRCIKIFEASRDFYHNLKQQ
jgi:phosphate transport system protein